MGATVCKMTYQVFLGMIQPAGMNRDVPAVYASQLVPRLGILFNLCQLKPRRAAACRLVHDSTSTVVPGDCWQCVRREEAGCIATIWVADLGCTAMSALQIDENSAEQMIIVMSNVHSVVFCRRQLCQAHWDFSVSPPLGRGETLRACRCHSS
jgi:hypothetical protein